MYVYFDKKGVLKEIINDEALRQGNYNVNKIYVFVEDRTYTSIDATYTLPSGVIVGPLNFDEFEQAQIPFDAKRDLRFFKYYTNYNFCVIDLSEAETTDNPEIEGASALDEGGVVHASLSIKIGETILALGEVNFMVEINTALQQGVVGSENYLSLSNYYYLRTLIIGNVSNYVPYTGATDNVNLGNHYLMAGYIDVTSTNRNKATFKGATGSGLVPYIKMNDETDTKSAYLGVDSNGDWVISKNTTSWTKVATKNDIKLYRHTVTVVPFGYTDFSVLTIISRSGDAISDLSDLDDNISGFVSGFYTDEHSLIFPLLECGVSGTSFGFAYIDENHGFVDPTWNNASVSNDVMEEI